MKEVNKHVDIVKKNPLAILTILGMVGGGGSLAKFHLFDELVRPMHSVIYHQKISNFLACECAKDLEEAQDMAEDEMIEEGFWKPRGNH